MDLNGGRRFGEEAKIGLGETDDLVKLKGCLDINQAKQGPFYRDTLARKGEKIVDGESWVDDLCRSDGDRYVGESYWI